MKFPFLLLFVVPLFAPTSAVGQQAANSSQTPSTTTSGSPEWTEPEREALLAKTRRGDAGVEFWLGAAYEQGWFGKADLQEALKWLRRAAKRGNADAQNNLGQMYEGGEGVPQNYAQAAKWYRRAAEHVPDLGGAGQGRNNLGLLFLDGRGVPKGYVQAYMWFRLARNDTDLSYAKSRMNTSQVAEGERMVTEWKNHHPEP